MKRIIWTFLPLFFLACSDEKSSSSSDNSEEKEPSTETNKHHLSTQQIKVDLPKSDMLELKSENYIEIQVDTGNQIIIEGTTVPLEYAMTHLKDHFDFSERAALKINADSNSHFEIFSELMAIAKELDLKIVLPAK